MITKEFADSLRARCEHEAADRLEELHQHFFETLNQRDSLRIEVAQLQKQLSQAIAERTPLKITNEFLGDALYRKAAKERDQALAEVHRLKAELANARSEPSRLEVAAMFYAADIVAGKINTGFDPDMGTAQALDHADALIEAEKESKEAN